MVNFFRFESSHNSEIKVRTHSQSRIVYTGDEYQFNEDIIKLNI